MAVNTRKYEVIYGWDLHDFEKKVTNHLSTFAKYDVRLEGGIQVVRDRDATPAHMDTFYQAVSRTLTIVE